MTIIGEWLRRIGYLLHRGRHEAALRQEMESHRAMLGEPRAFGNTLQMREASRDVWGWGWLDAIVRDLRVAARGLRRTPVFTLVTIASLVLGLAITATTVSVLNAYLIRSLPYPDSRQLYHVNYAPPGPWEPSGMTGIDWTSVSDVVEQPIAAAGEEVNIAAGRYSKTIRVVRATRGFVEGLRVGVTRGRPLTAEDFSGRSERVALIGHALWRDSFGSDPGVIGQVVRGESDARPGVPQTYVIVGVLPSTFYFGRDSRTALDLLTTEASPLRTYMVRLREGVPPRLAEQRLTEAARRAATGPIPGDWRGVTLESAHERYVGSLRPIILGVTVAAVLVLVIVCANVAVLMLLRAMQRQKEVAVRLALGCGRGDIARMLLAEASIIGVTAVTLGLALTGALLTSLAPVIETELGRPSPRVGAIAIDSNVLAIVGGIGLLIIVAISLAPMMSWGQRLMNALRQDGRTASDGPSMRRLRQGLIAFEVAGALLLLVGCGVMIRSVAQMMSTDLGFEPNGLRSSRVMLRVRNYPDAAAYTRFHTEYVKRVRETTATTMVYSSWPPFAAAPAVRIETDAGANTNASSINVSPGYFSIFKIAVQQGREFTDADTASGADVAVISETLARRLWPTGDALGRRVRSIEPTPRGPTAGPWRTVVGIAGDVRQGYDDPEQADFYTPRIPDGRYGSFYIRTDRQQASLFDDLRSAAASLDPETVINEPRFVSEANRALSGTRFITMLLTAFAGASALLAMLGIYGVTAYAVQQRHKEVAIRVALGASGSAIVNIFLRDGAMLVGAGTIAGLIGGVMLSRVLRNQVFGVQSFDFLTYVAAAVLLLAAGLFAAWWPARRAASTDPVSALNAGQ
jgi:putative ABC transport system permease protein